MRRDHAVLFAVAAILVAVGLLWPNGAVEAPRGDDHAAEVAGPAGSIAKGGLADAVANDLTRREATPEPAAVEAWLAHPYTLDLEVRLVDATGLPLPQRTLQWAARGCTLEEFGKVTDTEGLAQLQWPARAPQGEVVLADPLGILYRISLQHGVERKLTLGGRGNPETIEGRLMAVRLSRSTAASSQSIMLPDLQYTRDFGRRTAERDAQLHPFSVFRTAAASARPPDGAAFVAENIMAYFSSGGLADHLPAAAPPPISLVGTVYGEDGKPVVNTTVALLRGGPGSTQSSTTDKHGKFRFAAFTDGEYTVRAGGDREGLGAVNATLAKGTTTVAVHLQTGTTVRGVATTTHGQPFKRARLVWLADDGAWWDQTSADNDGRFLFANLPDGRGKVLLLPPGQDAELPLAVQTNVLANAGTLVLAHEPEATGRLLFEVPKWVGEADFGARLWHDDLGVGIELRRMLDTPQDAGAWTVDSLASGWYRLEVLVASLGCVDLGRHWLEPAGTLDLGVLPLPAPCEVELRLGDAPPAAANEHKPPPLPSPQSRIELYAIRNDLDVRLAFDNLVDHCDLRLPAGDYALARQAPGGPLEWHRFTARRGEVVRVPAGK